jgi:hypothetical protein
MVVTVRTHVHPYTGATFTTENHYRVARDSAGRVFEEHRAFVRGGTWRETYLFDTEITDPAHNVLYRCDPQTRTCQTLPFQVHVGANQDAPGNAIKKAVDLGQKKIDNLDVTGSREIVDIDTPAGDGRRSVESWFSPQLQINLMQRYSGAKSDAVDITVKNLVLADPNPALFVFPSGYKVLPAEQTSFQIAP